MDNSKKKKKTTNKVNNNDRTKKYEIKEEKNKKGKSSKKKHPKLKKVILALVMLIIIFCLICAGIVAGIFFSDKFKLTEEDFTFNHWRVYFIIASDLVKNKKSLTQLYQTCFSKMAEKMRFELTLG